MQLMLAQILSNQNQHRGQMLRSPKKMRLKLVKCHPRYPPYLVLKLRQIFLIREGLGARSQLLPHIPLLGLGLNQLEVQQGKEEQVTTFPCDKFDVG